MTASPMPYAVLTRDGSIVEFEDRASAVAFLEDNPGGLLWGADRSRRPLTLWEVLGASQ